MNQKNLTCGQPDRNSPDLVCGYPIPCPHHTAIIDTDVEFWVSMFNPRTKEWQRKKLKELNAKISIFETPKENSKKIEALQIILSQ